MGLFSKAKNLVQPGGVYKGVELKMNPEVFGPGISATTIPVSFVFGSGGVGDYINWFTCMEWVRAVHPHVDGRIYASPLFRHVLEWLVKDWPRWKVFPAEAFTKEYERGSQMAFAKPGTQLINACGAHLMDIGFMYFACTAPVPPKYKFLTEINYEEKWKWPELDPKSSYAIFTPCATSPVREMPSYAFDELVKYTLSKGITPVFLGKRELSSKYASKINGFNMSQGVDLRERTNLLEAVQIMRGAKFVIGLDNGLLHMAGTTNVPVIFGMNVTTLEHRTLRRKKGLTINITVANEKLGCIGCQSRLRYIQNFDFRNCFFQDNPERKLKCIELLWRDKSQRWKNAIDCALKEGETFRHKEKTIDIVY